MALTWISSNIFRLLKLFLRHLPPATILPGASAATHSCHGQAHRSQIGRWHWHRSSFTCKCLRKKKMDGLMDHGLLIQAFEIHVSTNWMDSLRFQYRFHRLFLMAPWFLWFSFLHMKFLLESLASTCQLCPGVWPVCGCGAQDWDLQLAILQTFTWFSQTPNISGFKISCVTVWDAHKIHQEKYAFENETRYKIHNFLSFTTGLTNTKIRSRLIAIESHFNLN